MGAAARLRALCPGERPLLALLYPIELVAAGVLALFCVTGVSPYAAFRPTTIALVITACTVLLLGAVLRSVHRGAFASLLIFPLLYALAIPVGLLLVALAAALMVSFDRLPHRTVTWASISTTATAFSTVLLALAIGNAVSTGRVGQALADLRQGGDLTPASNGALVDPEKPDVYLIVLDAYARPDNMRRLFSLDDSAFVDGLQERGFDVASNSHSNYPNTAETLVTMLNMAYLDEIPGVAGIHSGNPASDGSFRVAINSNNVFDLFHAHGYQTVAIGSGWEELALRQADVFLDSGTMNTFESALMGVTQVRLFVDALAPNFAGDQVRSRVNFDLATLVRVASTPAPQPRLVIAHIVCPHSPYVFGPNGEPRSFAMTVLDRSDTDATQQRENEMLLYRDQVAYLNARILSTLDAMLRSTRRQSAVVLMSDHGSRLETAKPGQLLTAEADQNLFASLTPGKPRLFGDSPTPVNIFRTLSDAYLGTSLGRLPDRSWIAPGEDPLRLTPLASATSP